MAVGNIALKIGIDGVDNASAAVDKARKALGGLADQSGKTKKATEELSAVGGGGGGIDAQKIQQRTAAAGGAIAALTAAMGPAGAALAETGRAATALGASANLIPGPIGIATAAVVGLAAGVYLLGKSTQETAAKMSLLGGADTAKLKEDLNLSVDAAVKLGQALADLNDRALRPSADLLKTVGANAESLGKDGGEAQAKFVQALQGGPEALKAFQAEFGKLNGVVATNIELAKKFGLDPAALGLAQALTAEEQAKADIAQSLARIQKERAETGTRELELARQTALEIESATVAGRLEAGRRKVALEEQIAGSQRIVESERAILTGLERESRARQEIANTIATIAGRADLLDARASATADKQQRASLQSEAITARQLAAVKALNAFDALHGQTLDGKLATERDILATKVAQSDAAKMAFAQAAAATKAQEDAERRARGVAAAAKRKAELAELRKAQEQFAADEAKDLEDLAKTRKDLENAAKVASIQANKAVQDGLDAVRTAKIALTQDPAVKAYLQQQDAQIRLARELKAAEEDAAIGIAGAAERAAAAKINAAAAVAAIEKREFDRRTAEAAIETAKTRERVGQLIALAGPATAAAQRIAGPGGLVGGLAQAVTSGQELVKTWNNTGSNTAGIIGAVGSVAAAVVDGERTKAGVMMLTEGAQAAALAFVPGMQAQAAGHAASAVLWGAVAGGLVGGASSPTNAAGGGAAPGGFGAQAGATSAAAAAPGAGTTTINNFNAPLGTKYEIGKQIAQNQKAAAPWAKATAGV